MMNLNNASYETTALIPAQYPNNAPIDITFVGRSNVGKSSLINTLLNRKSLARVGQTPGKTRQINFFNIDNCLYFVDLPGYGYSKMSKGESEAVGKRIETYLQKREQLKLVILVLDIRHSPSSDDKLMYDYLVQTKIPFIIVTSKSDKLGVTQIEGRINDIRIDLGDENSKIFAFSAIKKAGAKEILDYISSIL